MNKTNRVMDDIRKSIPDETKIMMELSVSIANRIYYELERRNLSQKDFAKMIGKTETEVSRWLSGTHNMTISTIAKISAALGVSIIQTSSTNTYNSALYSSEQVRYLSDSVDYEDSLLVTNRLVNKQK